MSVAEITPLVLTFNEAPNIGRTLGRLTWAREILVVDSFSTDETLEIVRSFPQVRVVQRKFDDHTSQWNFGLDQIKSEWVLTLDADYMLTDELVAELQNWKPSPGVNAFFAHFKYCIAGRPLRATLYPPRAVLFRVKDCRYEQDGHTQRLRVNGNTSWLRAHIDHDDRKPLDRWLAEQNRYAQIEARYLLATHAAELGSPDRLRRKIIPAPIFVFFYTLLVKGLILDGWPGWYYVLQRTLAEIILSLKLMEEKLKRGHPLGTS